MDLAPPVMEVEVLWGSPRKIILRPGSEPSWEVQEHLADKFALGAPLVARQEAWAKRKARAIRSPGFSIERASNGLRAQEKGD